MLPHISPATTFSIKFYGIIPKESGLRQQCACLLGYYSKALPNLIKIQGADPLLYTRNIYMKVREGFNDNSVRVVNKLRVKEVITLE